MVNSDNPNKLTEKREKMQIFNCDEEISFFSPLISGNYRNVGAAILSRKQKVPTGDCIASLLYAAYSSSEAENEPLFNSIKKVMEYNWLWVYNINVWTDKGVYTIKDFQALGTTDTTSVAQLEKMLKEGEELSWGGVRLSDDGRVGFAPKGSYKLVGHTNESLARDGLIIAIYGVEGANKISELSKKFENPPKVWGFEFSKGQPETKTVSAIYSSWDLPRLVINCAFNGEYGIGFASGINKGKRK